MRAHALSLMRFALATDALAVDVSPAARAASGSGAERTRGAGRVRAIATRCLHCRTPLVFAVTGEPLNGATLEHVVPRSWFGRGAARELTAGLSGPDDPHNLALACAACNHAKGRGPDARGPGDARAREVVAEALARRQRRWRADCVEQAGRGVVDDRVRERRGGASARYGGAADADGVCLAAADPADGADGRAPRPGRSPGRGRGRAGAAAASSRAARHAGAPQASGRAALRGR